MGEGNRRVRVEWASLALTLFDDVCFKNTSAAGVRLWDVSRLQVQVL